MLPRPASDPLWIATPKALQTMTATIASEPILAIDTESNSLFAYRERVCLVQVSTPSTDYLIDTLALEDLSPARGDICQSAAAKDLPRCRI